jgi:hypothetical protein
MGSWRREEAVGEAALRVATFVLVSERKLTAC